MTIDQYIRRFAIDTNHLAHDSLVPCSLPSHHFTLSRHRRCSCLPLDDTHIGRRSFGHHQHRGQSSPVADNQVFPLRAAYNIGDPASNMQRGSKPPTSDPLFETEDILGSLGLDDDMEETMEIDRVV